MTPLATRIVHGTDGVTIRVLNQAGVAYEPALAQYAADFKAATGADVVAAACPFCNTMFRDGLATVAEKPPQLLDIAQIAAARIAD